MTKIKILSLPKNSFRFKNCIKIFSFTSLLYFTSCSGTRPDNLNVINGKLNPCPSTPNCVSSQTDQLDSIHFILPILYSSSKEEAKMKLEKVLSAHERTEIIKNENSLIQVEFTTFLMRFKDDALFYFDDENKVIHVRSASRLGSGDLGVNRKRIEEIRLEFNKK